MILDSIFEASVRFFSFVYKLFEQYVVNYFINFGRGFEQIFVMLVVTIFMLITIYILIKRIKKYQNPMSLWSLIAQAEKLF
jgi:ABC-type iron transport system FetAB permease component